MTRFVEPRGAAEGQLYKAVSLNMTTSRVHAKAMHAVNIATLRTQGRDRVTFQVYASGRACGWFRHRLEPRRCTRTFSRSVVAYCHTQVERVIMCVSRSPIKATSPDHHLGLRVLPAVLRHDSRFVKLPISLVKDPATREYERLVELCLLAASLICTEREPNGSEK